VTAAAWGGKGCIRQLAGLITIIVGVGGCVGYFYFANQFLDKVLFPATAENAGRNINRANQVRPWLFLFPAIVRARPLSRLSGVRDAAAVADRPRCRRRIRRSRQLQSRWPASRNSGKRMRNNMLWLIVVPAARPPSGCWPPSSPTGSWGNIAKSLIFMPMAISFVGAAVIFKLVYDAPARRPGPDRYAQRGLAGFRRRHAVGLFVCKVVPRLLLAGFAA
jgi:alpha-glucoside transport system permease protein